MSGKQEKISIIIPIYNTDDYLPLCLESCVNQTLMDIEIICINDGSTDRSSEVVREYSAADPRVRLIEKQNEGRSAARNLGIQWSDGHIVMFLDSDDSFAPYACERIWKEWVETGFDIAAFGCNLIPAENPDPPSWFIEDLTVPDGRFKGFVPEILFNNKAAKPYIGRQAYDRRFIEREGLQFHEGIEIGEDLAFQMESFPSASRFSFLSDKLYNYRWSRDGSTVKESKNNLSYRMENHMTAVENITQYWNRKGWLKSYGRYYLQWMIDFLTLGFSELPPDAAKKISSRLQNVINCNFLSEIVKELDLYSKRRFQSLTKEKTG